MSLYKAIKMQFNLMINKRNFIIVFFIMMFYSLGIYLANVFLNINKDITTIYSADAYCSSILLIVLKMKKIKYELKNNKILYFLLQYEQTKENILIIPENTDRIIVNKKL